ncbi:hypothetical protein [Pseudocnuella soli]|uniref:hypothetical protein n=1 Tax=Pseudocnuella soli TaxID=2502779 RepID=UPI001F00BB4B|nr:hypothetical protein [Pseudocnuella soli]
MLKILPRIATITLVVMLAANTSGAQETDTTRPVSVDPELLALQNARIPKEYTIGTINVTGVNYLDTGIVVSISGLQPGDKLMIPGTDAFSKAITNLWRQRLFSNVQIFITSLREEVIDIEIAVTERPKLGSFKFQGVKNPKRKSWRKKRPWYAPPSLPKIPGAIRWKPSKNITSKKATRTYR